MTTANATEKTLDEANQEVSDAMYERMMDARYAHLLEGAEDMEDRRSKLREFFREVVHIYRKAALKPMMGIAPTDDVHGWGTGQTKVWIEAKYERGGVLVSVGGFEWMLKPGFGQPTPEFARDHVNRKDLRISGPIEAAPVFMPAFRIEVMNEYEDAGLYDAHINHTPFFRYSTEYVSVDIGRHSRRYFPGQPFDRAATIEHIRLAREDAEQKAMSPSNALAALRGRVLHEYMSTGFFEEAGELLATNDGVPMHVQDSRGVIRLCVREFTSCQPQFVEAIIGGMSRHYFLDRPIDRLEIHRHIRNVSKYARGIIERATGLTNVPSWLKRSAAEDIDDTGHVFSGPTIIGGPSALADVLGKMGPRPNEHTNFRCVTSIEATEAMRSIADSADKIDALAAGMKKAGPLGLGLRHPPEILKKARVALAIRDSKVNRLPYLVVDLSEEYKATEPHRFVFQNVCGGGDWVESREEWVARKTCESEEVFSATIRNTLREWPSHQGQPMIIHTHVDQGVFVLTLKAAP